ncbi:MAG: DUF881 domain-containing protein [Acidimicrobiia bacterium]
MVAGCAAALLLSIAALATGAAQRSGGIARPARVGLARIVSAEKERLASINTRLTSLEARLSRLEQLDVRSEAGSLDARLAAARRAMGLVPATGRGISIALDDAPDASTTEGDPNNYVVHSEDVQAVANGLWGAGAEAVSVNSQRVTTTSALLCVGNTLLVNGTVQSPPYRFLAVGGGTSLESRFISDALVARVRETFDRYGLVFSMARLEDATVPAYDATPVRHHADPQTAEDAED